MKQRVLVKAWFDHRAFEATVISESSANFGRRMLLVEPDCGGAAVWRDPDDCKPMPRSNIQMPLPLNQESMTPDWTAYWSASQAQRELTGYVHKGPGWYPSADGKGMMLVQKVSMLVKDDPQLFKFYIWNSINALELMKHLVKLPVHT